MAVLSKGLQLAASSVCMLLLQDAGGLPGPSSLLEQLPAISETFSGNSLVEIYAALRAKGDAWSNETLATLAKCAT